MKKLLWTICLLICFSVCACGKKEQNRKQTVATPTPTTSPTETVSGAAVTVEPTPVSAQAAYEQAENMVANMSLEEKAGQMFLVDLCQLDSKRTIEGTARKMTKAMGEAIHRYNIGGVYLTEANIKNEKQAKKLVKNLQSKAVTGGSLYVAVEEDGGGSNSISTKVAGLNDTGFISPNEMGTNMDVNQIYQSGKKIGEELGAWGVNLNLSPVADLGNENNPEYAKRCLGSDAEQVSGALAGYVKGMRDGGLAVTLKHFPGIGNVPGEYTETILENKDSLMSLRENNLEVYQSGIDAGADCVMVANVAVTEIMEEKIPACMSQDIVTKLLREELNFEGVIMTTPYNDNAIQKKYTVEFAVTEAVNAGCDMIVLPAELEKGYKALLSAVKKGEISEKRIDQSVCRILQNKIQRGILVNEWEKEE